MDIEEFERHTRDESEPIIRGKAYRYATSGCKCEKVYFAIARDGVDKLLDLYHDQIDKKLREGVGGSGLINHILERVDVEILDNLPSAVNEMRQGISAKVKDLPTDESLIALAKEHITSKKYLSKFEEKIEELYK